MVFCLQNLLNINLCLWFSLGAMLLLWTETFQACYFTYCLQLYSVFGSLSWAWLQSRSQQCELLSVCGTVYQDPTGWREEQKKEGEAALISSKPSIIKKDHIMKLFFFISELSGFYYCLIRGQSGTCF